MTLLQKFSRSRSVGYVAMLVGMICIGLVAIQPFTLNQMPQTADGFLHLFRVGAVDYSLKVDNPLWVRYSTAIVYGYGAPLFNYFPPLSYYLGSWLHTIGLTFVQSWLAMMVVYTLTSAVGMFLLGRLWAGSAVGGWMTAIAFIYAPYYLFDSVARGTSSELGALAVLPFVMYGFTRVAFYGRRVDVVSAVIAYALFIPMHTLITLHGTALLGLYCLFLVMIAEDKRRVFLRLMIAGVVGFMLTAFFWMPAIVETDAVKIDLIAQNLDQIDVTRHLRPLNEVLALPHTADPTQQNQLIPITLSWVQIVISGVGLVLAWRWRDRAIHHVLLFLGLLTSILVFLNMPASVWIWENVPLMAYTQFPWRIMGLASLTLALMTGISVWLIYMRMPSKWGKLGLFSVLTLLVLVYATPWTYSLYRDDIALNDVRDIHDFERRTGQLTISSYSEYLPITTDESQLDPNRLIERFETSDVIPRLLPDDRIAILSQSWTSTSGELTIRTTEPQTLLFDWLYVEGWTASIDGEPVTVYPSSPVGLVALDVPQGEFELMIALEATAIQSVSVLMSLGGVVALLLVLVLWRYVQGISHQNAIVSEFDWRIWGLVMLVGGGVFLLKTLVLDHQATGIMTRQYRDVVNISPLANFDNQIDLLHAQTLKNENNGDFVTIKMDWRRHDEPIETDYSAVIRLRNPEGIVIAERNVFALGGLATSNWLSGAYIRDEIEFDIPAYIPPLIDGQAYTFDVSLFDAKTLQPLSVINAQGNPEDALYVLGNWTPDMTDEQPDEVPDVVNSASDGIGLYVPQMPEFSDVVTVGDEIEFNWTWQKIDGDDSLQDHLARVLWVDADRDVIAESSPFPIVPSYPTSGWMANEVYRAYQRLIVPSDLPAGSYAIALQLSSDTGEDIGEPQVLDVTMTVNVPERYFEQPVVETETDTTWDNGIRLIGYTLGESGHVNLVWQTQNTIDKSLRLFVHILDDADLIVAQSDGIPVDWTRPTTGWIEDEFVTTVHSFGLAQGDYRVRVGWYDPNTGTRVGIDESDAIILENLLMVREA